MPVTAPGVEAKAVKSNAMPAAQDAKPETVPEPDRAGKKLALEKREEIGTPERKESKLPEEKIKVVTAANAETSPQNAFRNPGPIPEAKAEKDLTESEGAAGANSPSGVEKPRPRTPEPEPLNVVKSSNTPLEVEAPPRRKRSGGARLSETEKDAFYDRPTLRKLMETFNASIEDVSPPEKSGSESASFQTD